jgi:hypothetical protein
MTLAQGAGHDDAGTRLRQGGEPARAGSARLGQRNRDDPVHPRRLEPSRQGRIRSDGPGQLPLQWPQLAAPGTAKLADTSVPPDGVLDELRLMHYSANWGLLGKAR